MSPKRERQLQSVVVLGLISAGVAVIYWPAGLIVAGLLILADLFI